MKITHKLLPANNRSFTIPEALGGKITFDENGFLETTEEIGNYLVEAGFSEATEKTEEATKASIDLTDTDNLDLSKLKYGQLKEVAKNKGIEVPNSIKSQADLLKFLTDSKEAE